MVSVYIQPFTNSIQRDRKIKSKKKQNKLDDNDETQLFVHRKQVKKQIWSNHTTGKCFYLLIDWLFSPWIQVAIKVKSRIYLCVIPKKYMRFFKLHPWMKIICRLKKKSTHKDVFWWSSKKFWEVSSKANETATT